MRRLLLVPALIVGCASSGGDPPAPASAGSAASAASAASTSPASAASAASAAALVADPGPSLERKTGKVPATVRDPITVSADARELKDGAIYLRVAMPAEMSALMAQLPPHSRLIVEGPRYGLAIPASEGRVADRPLAWVRFAGKDVPERFTLVWNHPGRVGDSGVRQTIHVETKGAVAETVVAEGFWTAAGRWFERRGRVGLNRVEPFYAFAAARSNLFADVARPERLRRPRPRRRGDVGEAMAFYTGFASVEEALQADRGLRLGASERDTPSLALSEIEAVTLPGHPWAELMKQTDAQPVIEPLAHYVPADMLYLHFHDLRTLVKLAADAETLLTPLARTLEEQAGARHFNARYERQLAIQRSALSKALGHVAVKGVALAVSDPFLREGTDVSILFHVRNRATLMGALNTYEAQAKARRPDARISTYTLGDTEVRLFSTTDHDIQQHRLELGEVLILSNSRAAVEKILAAKAGSQTPLAGSGDFRYFRTIYPFGPEEEDGFLFISDAFVQHVISPRVKILQARRIAGHAAVQSVGFAALLYGWLHGEPPPNLPVLQAAGLITDADLDDGAGGRVRFDPDTGPSSARWGDAQHITPIIELPLTQVSPAERDAYDAFRLSYQSYWRGFIDPIGVRLRRDEAGGLSLDARMMPLIQRSEYNEMARTVGDARLKVGPLADGMRLTLPVAADSKLRRELDSLGRALTQQRDVGLGWLGDWVMVGVADRSSLWDLALALGDVPSAGGRDAWRDREARKKIFDRAPLYVGAHVRDGLSLAATLTALRAFVEGAVPGLVEWGPDGEHREVKLVRVREKFDGEGVALHYAIVQRVFLLSIDRHTLTQQIDAVLDGKLPQVRVGKKDQSGESQAVLALKPNPDGWLSRTIAGLLEQGVMSANSAAAIAYEALARGRGALPADPEAQRAEALRWLGVEPISAHGGTFEIGADGLVHHSLYGSELEPNWPAVPVPGSATARFLSGLERLRLGLSYEGDGIDRGLHTTVRWARRP